MKRGQDGSGSKNRAEDRQRAGVRHSSRSRSVAAGRSREHRRKRNDRSKETAMSNVNEIVVRYLSVWNEQDATRRRDLVAKTWSDDGSYVDGARQGAGHGGIDAMIAKAQETHPGYRLALASGIETHHQYVRFSWVAGGTAEAPLYIKGTDIGIIADAG